MPSSSALGSGSPRRTDHPSSTMRRRSPHDQNDRAFSREEGGLVAAHEGNPAPDSTGGHLVGAEIERRLRCPTCRAPVRRSSGGVTCQSGHEMPLTDGYLDAGGSRLLELQSTVKSFGYEWTTFDRIMPEDEQFWRSHFQDTPLESLAGGVALDAGCGKGRFAYFTAPLVRELVALDASDAVVAAARNLQGHPNCTVIRGDILDPPLAAESFDFVYCMGVLHHLPDPEAGFRSLVNLMSPGGLLLTYLYSWPEEIGIRRASLAMAAALRRGTTRMPHSLVRMLSAPLAAALYLAFVIPGTVGERRGVRPLAGLPLATYRGRPLRSLWLDTLDRLSAPIERRYTWPELREWFERYDLTVMAVREDAGWYVTARRPEVSASVGADRSE